MVPACAAVADRADSPVTPTTAATAAAVPTAVRTLVRIPRSPHHARDRARSRGAPPIWSDELDMETPRVINGTPGSCSDRRENRMANAFALRTINERVGVNRDRGAWSRDRRRQFVDSSGWNDSGSGEWNG